MAALAKAEKILAETEKTLADAMTRLREVQKGVKKLQDQLIEEEAKKAELEKQLCEERIARAIKLIVGLSDKQKRWIIIMDNIKMSLKNVVGDIFLSSGACIILIYCPNYLLILTCEKCKMSLF